MTQALKLSASGMSAVAAQAVLGDVATGLVAAGSTLATALALPASINFIATAAAATGVILAANANPGDAIFVFNGGANAVLVYPPTSTGTVQGAGAGVGFSVGTLKSATFVAAAPLTWAADLSA